MDSFGEQLVKKHNTTGDILKKLTIIIGGIGIAAALMALSFATNFMVLTMLAVGVLFGTVWLISETNLEYEYIVTNEDLDVDKIIGKRKRKRLITVKLGTVEEFGVYDGTQGEDVNATVIASDATGINAYYIIANHKTHGKTMVIFSPDLRIINLIMSGLPHKVKANTRLHVVSE